MLSSQGAFFFLLQSEEGDLYKVTIEHEDEEVRSLKIKYFDTVPTASNLCILKSGFLFVASEFGNQYVIPQFAVSTWLMTVVVTLKLSVSIPKARRRRRGVRVYFHII
jgi:Mono-functional DNA-alkylating methyl methanesulfonate N-term